MEGITTACVAFIFVCIIYPHLVKVRAQFYLAFALILIILVLRSLADIIGVIEHPGFYRFAAGLNCLLQAAVLLLLVLSTGGLTLHELAGNIKGAYEVMRRGETEKEVIIPKSAQENAPPPGRTDVPPPPPPSRSGSSIPLE